MDTKKIVLIGDANVGKTTFVQRLLNGNYQDKYIPTLGVEVEPIRRGNKCYNIWDCAGDPRFRGLGDGYYIQSHGAIVMCDASNPTSMQNVTKWANEYRRICNNNIVIVINKSDLYLEPIKEGDYVVISCLNNENLDKVLSYFN